MNSFINQLNCTQHGQTNVSMQNFLQNNKFLASVVTLCDIFLFKI